jgi:predicted amidohydrolase
MNTLMILGLMQLLGEGPDPDAAAAKGLAFARRAKLAGADLVVFPEMWSVSYGDTLWSTPNWQRLAQPVTGPFVSSFQVLASELDLAIAVGFLEQWDDALGTQSPSSTGTEKFVLSTPKSTRANSPARRP